MSNDIVNIGSGKGCSIREYSDTICRMLEVDNREIRYDTSKFSGTKSKILNIEKLNGLLPERKTISLEEGLSSTIQWMKQEYFEPLKGREKK